MGNSQSYEEEVLYNDTITRYQIPRYPTHKYEQNRLNDTLGLNFKKTDSYSDLAFYNDPLDVYKTKYFKSKPTFSYKCKLCMKKLFSCHKQNKYNLPL